MLGQMMTLPLTIPSILEFAAKYHADTEIVSRTVEGPVHRSGYADAARRARKLGNALRALGIRAGDIIGTVAWNGYRHFELYYGVAGIGGVCHTINPRLFPAQIDYIINDAADRYLFVDLTFVPLLEGLADKLSKVQGVVVMTDRAHMPATKLANVLCYEELIADQADTIEWPVADENTAASLCYTSGTTGNPRGVLYSHRSSVLHALAVSLPDSFALSARDTVLPVVPMFHVNAWGLPYAAPLTGCKLVLPGPRLDGVSICGLIEDEGVTFSAAVPTVWMGMLAYLRDNKKGVANLNRVVIGGSACPAAMIDGLEAHGVRAIHAWGMTETSPLGTINSPKHGTRRLSAERQRAQVLKQGRPVFGIDVKIVDSASRELPCDGKAFGNLKVRGRWVCAGYFRDIKTPAHDEPGWFETGDVATIDADGYIQIVDRTKDVIKSGGEWISSIELENVAVAHPAVAEAAVIARCDEKWGERPLLIVVLRDGMSATAEELRNFYCGRVAKWWMPDEVLIVDQLPHTATGKLLKSELRRLYGRGVLASA